MLASGFVVQFVNGVRVGPEDTDVRSRGRHCRHQVNDFVGVGHAFRVRELRDAPDPLDRRVGAGDVVDFVHVGTVCVHLDRDHFDAERTAHREVTVVSGRGADELDSALTGPRFVTARNAEEHCTDEGVVHDVQRGVAEDKDLFCRDVKKIAEKLFRFRQTVEDPVVPAVETACAETVPAVADDGQHFGGKVELSLIRFAPGEVEGKVPFGPFVKFCLFVSVDVLEFLLRHCGKSLCIHCGIPLCLSFIDS